MHIVHTQCKYAASSNCHSLLQLIKSKRSKVNPKDQKILRDGGREPFFEILRVSFLKQPSQFSKFFFKIFSNICEYLIPYN